MEVCAPLTVSIYSGGHEGRGKGVTLSYQHSRLVAGGGGDA